MHNEFLPRAVRTSNQPSVQGAVVRPAKRFGTIFAAFLLALALVAVPAQQAFAHDYLMASNPEDGAALDAQPSQVVLSFNNDIQKLGAQMIILDQSKSPVASGTPVVEGKNVSFDVPADLGNGVFTVNWRVVSSDSHPIDGTLSYTVGDVDQGSAPAPDETATTTDTPDAEQTSKPSAETTAGESSNANQPNEDTAPLPWTGIVIGGVLGLGAGVVLMLLGKRKKNS